MSKLNLIKQFTAALLLICIVQITVTNVKAQKNRQLVQDESNERRIALIIGNGAYSKAKSLPNPPNDATDMAKTLNDLGFEVLSGVNQNKRQMETLIREFGAKLANGGVGLFYYAGHGIQVGGENYLVPVDADIPEEDEVAYSAVSLNLVLTKMNSARNDLNIVILDACRNNPFARSWRSFRDNSNSDGLAKVSPPTGTLVLYATEPGKVASDGAGRNGLFTEALLKQITKPNLEYDQMVKQLSADVWQKSNKQQLPWKEGNTLQDFYFAITEQKSNIVNTPLIIEKQSEPVIDDFIGSYSIILESGVNPFDDKSSRATLTFVQQEKTFAGTFKSESQTGTVKNCNVMSEGFSCEIIFDLSGQKFIYTVKGTIKGNRISGIIESVAFPAMKFSGTKNP